MQKSERINLRVTPAEKEAWEKAAGGRVSEWLRRLANDAVSPWSATGHLVALGEEEFLPRLTQAAKTKKAACSRALYHQKGVYCKSCGS